MEKSCLSCIKPVVRSWVVVLIAGFVALHGVPSSVAQASLDLKWLRSVWEGEEHIPLAVDVNSGGDAYVTGYSSEATPFLALIDSEGNEEWHRRLSTDNWGEEWLVPWYRGSMTGYMVATHGKYVFTVEGPTYVHDSGQRGSGGFAIVKYSAEGDLRGVVPLGNIRTTWSGYISNIGVDRNGNAYVSGTFAGSLFTGEHRLLSERGLPPYEDARSSDVFVAKYAPDGVLIWTRRLGGPGGDRTGGGPFYIGGRQFFYNRSPMAVDGDGNVYLDFHTYTGALLSGPGMSVLVSPRERALVSLSAEGEFRWARTERDLGLPGHTVQHRLAADLNGNIVAVWSRSERGYGGEIDEAYLLKFSGDGELIFMKRLIFIDVRDTIAELATDGRGYIYLGGMSLSETTRSDTDGFVVWFDSGGTLQGVVKITGPGYQGIGGLSIGLPGDLYITGAFTEQVILGRDTLVTDDERGAFVAKFGSTITNREEAADVPEDAPQLANYPNPFAEQTRIDFWLPQRSDVRLTVYDILGRRVALLVDRPLPRGWHEVTFRAGTRSPGMYFYRLESAGYRAVGRMHLAR